MIPVTWRVHQRLLRFLVQMNLPVADDSQIAPTVQELHDLLACSRPSGPSLFRILVLLQSAKILSIETTINLSEPASSSLLHRVSSSILTDAAPSTSV